MTKKTLTAEDFKVGTLILKTGYPNRGYGFVCDREYWLGQFQKIEPEKAQYFIDLESRLCPGYILPLIMFSRERDKRFSLSNVGGDIVIIPQLDRLEETLSQILVFAEAGSVLEKYIRQVQSELQAFKNYLAGTETGMDPDLMKLFRNAIPREKYFDTRGFGSGSNDFFKGLNWKYAAKP